MNYGPPMKRTIATLALASVAAIGIPTLTLASGDPEAAPSTTLPVAPLGEPITSGSMTVTLVDRYYSTAASQLVVVLEVTATETVDTGGYSSVYVGPDGQQVEAVDAVEPGELFPGATAVVVMVFPAATSGGNVMFSAYTSADYNDLGVTIPVPA